jgi:hypothetical protein
MKRFPSSIGEESPVTLDVKVSDSEVTEQKNEDMTG